METSHSWSSALAWKAGKGEIPSRVRISPFPQEKFNKVKFRRKSCYDFRRDSKPI